MKLESKHRCERWIVPCALLALMLVGSLPAGAQDDLPERFNANVISAGPGRSGTTTMEITVERWSTDEERAKLAEAVKDDDSSSVVTALRGLDRVGMARLRNQTSERLHFAGQFTQGETRHVILATDRPIAMGEARRNTRSLDNNVSIIKLELDADGNGEGTFIVGAEVAFDAETQTLEITHASTQPVRLTRVRRRN